MQRYAWTGHTPTGAASGVLEAASAGAAADMLLGRGITPLTIAAATGSSPQDTSAGTPPRTPGTLRGWFAPRVQAVDLLLFSRQLHTLLRSGVPILRALAGLQESAANVQMKATLQEVRHSLESGLALSLALGQQQQVFNPFYVALVRVGEMTGRLDEVFLRLFHHIEFELFMHQQIKSALRYPTFVICAMGAAIGVINTMVIPAFATVFESAGTQLPLVTRILMATSKFTLDFGWLIVLGGIAAAFSLRAWKATTAGRLRWDELMLKAPIAGKVVRKAMLARFARSFAISLKSGVPIAQALSVVAQTVDNQYLARKVENMRMSVERGDSILRSAAGIGVFTPIVLQMIAVGEETGAIDQLMDDVADLYSNEVQYELKTLSQQLEPILITFLGFLVLMLALGVFLPIWDLGRTAFQRG